MSGNALRLSPAGPHKVKIGTKYAELSTDVVTRADARPPERTTHLQWRRRNHTPYVLMAADVDGNGLSLPNIDTSSCPKQSLLGVGWAWFVRTRKGVGTLAQTGLYCRLHNLPRKK